MTTNGTAPKLSLHRKIAEVMAAAERIPKNGTAPAQMGGFKFVQVGDVADAVRKGLAERNVTLLPSNIELLTQSEHETRNGGTMTTESYRVTWTFSDGESGESFTVQSVGTGADTGDKAAPKAQTNALKYGLLMSFLLSTGDDPELSDSSDRKARRNAVADAAVAGQGFAPRQDPADGGLIGTAKVVQSGGQDMELRQTPTGWRLAFRLSEGRSGWKVVATDALAGLVATNKAAIEDQRVTCWGTFVPRTFDKKLDNGETKTITYQELSLTRLKVGELDLSAPEPEEDDAPSADEQAEFDALLPVLA